jgi:hypothetical protein
MLGHLVLVGFQKKRAKKKKREVIGGHFEAQR